MSHFNFLFFLPFWWSLFWATYKTLEKIGKDPGNILPLNFAKRIRLPLFLLLTVVLVRTFNLQVLQSSQLASFVPQLGTIVIIGCITWIVIILLQMVKKHLLTKYDISQSDNLRARKVHTQYIILENTLIFIVVLFAAGIALMSFNSIRNIGISILTSAGIAGIIIGFAPKKPWLRSWPESKLRLPNPSDWTMWSS